MQRKAKLVDLLQSDEVKLFLKTHKTGDPVALALKYSGKLSFESPPVFELIRIYQRGVTKLPTWVEKEALFTRKAYEQSSSELSANWKAKQMVGDELINLCGGIGVDDFAFSKRFKKVTSLEIDSEVHDLAEYNLSLLGAKNCVRINTSAEDFLKTLTEKPDWIYLDPDRRDGQRKVFGLEESSPDVINLWPQLTELSKSICIKASPMLDIRLALSQIPSINSVQVISIGGEVKEVLLLAKQGTVVMNYAAIDLAPFKEYTSNEKVSLLPAEIEGSNYFYECNAALIKAELCGSYVSEQGAKGLIPNSAFAISEELIPDFFGRTFQIIQNDVYSRKKFDHYLKEKKIQKANLNRRNFHFKVEELKKHHKIKDGGDDYFFFYIGKDKKARFVHGTKLSV